MRLSQKDHQQPLLSCWKETPISIGASQQTNRLQDLRSFRVDKSLQIRKLPTMLYYHWMVVNRMETFAFLFIYLFQILQDYLRASTSVVVKQSPAPALDSLLSRSAMRLTGHLPTSEVELPKDTVSLQDSCHSSHGGECEDFMGQLCRKSIIMQGSGSKWETSSNFRQLKQDEITILVSNPMSHLKSMLRFQISSGRSHSCFCPFHTQLSLPCPWQVCGWLMSNTDFAQKSSAVPPPARERSTPKCLHPSEAHGLMLLGVSPFFVYCQLLSLEKRIPNPIQLTNFASPFRTFFLLAATDSSVKIRQPFNLMQL